MPSENQPDRARPTSVAVRPKQSVVVNRPEPMWPTTLAEAKEMGQIACELLGKPKEDSGTLAGIILSGLEIGIGPMTSARGIWIVEGQPYISANLQRAIILASPVCRSFTVKPVLIPMVDADGKQTGAKEPGAQAMGVRADNGDAMKVTVRESQYEHMKRTRSGKDNLAWKNNLGDMLIARATGKLARGLFSDVLFGMGVADVRQQADGQKIIEVEPLESDEGAFAGAETVDPAADTDWEEAQRTAHAQERRAAETTEPAGREADGDGKHRPWGLDGQGDAK